MIYPQAGVKKEMNEMTSKIPGMISRLSDAGTKETPITKPNLENMQTETIFTKVNLRPNPFSTSVTLEVTSGQNKQVIVRMTNTDGQIIKLFSWYLLKGTNVTTITELMPVHNGAYSLHILDSNGELLHASSLNKA
jgi:hypothetical protein